MLPTCLQYSLCDWWEELVVLLEDESTNTRGQTRVRRDDAEEHSKLEME